ncbi:MAG: FAD-dependent oxidoreductase [Betaproteobacteria bacterium]|nr:MAG: FAD-dependent oxidoreductase [Betaproteobacteria bacterium]
MIHEGNFVEEYDVIVVGFGFGGAATAIEAHDAGARVLLIEKMPHPGGISICAGGGIRCAKSEEGAFAYLQHTNDGTTPDDVLRAFVRGSMQIENWLRGLAKVNGAQIGLRERNGNYPFPGTDSFHYVSVKTVPGFDAPREYPHVHGGRDGVLVFKLMHDSVKTRGIEIRFDCPAERLLRAPNGEVRGLRVRRGEASVDIAARQAVVLACGGFEADYEMQRQFLRIKRVQSASTRANTGDGIRMAQEAGAALWHMWNLHAGYGFRHPDPNFPFAIRVKRLPDWTPNGEGEPLCMPWILLDRTGRRFMNEYPPYLQDTGHRSFDDFDTVAGRFRSQPSWLVVDDDGRKLYPLGHLVYNDSAYSPYRWSADNLGEVESGVLKRADSIEELARIVDADVGTVRASVATWNAACDAGQDADYGRPAPSMMPLRRFPFLVGEVWPVLSNTQGGPVHDARQRVLNAFGEPIPRLYEAGELGSIWGHLYLGGGNLTECFVTGRIAGREAAGLERWR